MERKIVFTSKEREVMRQFLSGKLSTREAGKKLGMSHQNVINVVCRLAQQLYREGKVTF